MPDCTIDELRIRLAKGERGDDVPILMADFGCDYDQACDLVFAGRSAEASEMLEKAVQAPPPAP